MTDITKIPEIQDWIDIVEQGTYATCEEQKLLVKKVKRDFRKQKIYVDTERLEKYMHLLDAYVPFETFAWQRFVIALHDCTFWESNGMPRWSDLFCLIGRGAGKDGMIAMESFVLTSPYNGIREYDVDICANNEDQAMRPLKDLTGFFEMSPKQKKIKKFYHWTKEAAQCMKTRSTVRGRTNNPKGKDGMRSGIVVFNEIHQYVDYKNIDVFTTGLGKKEHPRRSYYTTNGEVREGPLDDLMADAEDILRNDTDDNGMLPFICKLDSKEEIDDESMWPKANPSIPFLPNLLEEIRKEYRDWKKSPDRSTTFVERRMNIPDTKKEAGATSWENIARTNQELPDLKGWNCTVGIDYSKTTDWAAVNFHFKSGNERYDINHAWICRESADIPRIKAPWKIWVKNGLMDYVDDVEIHPAILVGYIQEMGKNYNITKVVIDNFRYSLLSDALSKAGFSKENDNLMLIKNADIIKVQPVIDHCFVQGYFHWGDQPVLRWATNNTKVIPYGKDVGADKGSFVYAKIEAKSRKTDPFMALVASMVPEMEIKERPKIDQRFMTITI